MKISQLVSILVFQLFLLSACGSTDDVVGRSIASVPVQKADVEFEKECKKKQGRYSWSGCLCESKKEYFNPFDGKCE